jgi:hypothetical protein
MQTPINFWVEAFYLGEVTPLPCLHLRNTAYSGKVEQVEAVDAFICIYRQENIGKGRNGFIINPEKGVWNDGQKLFGRRSCRLLSRQGMIYLRMSLRFVLSVVMGCLLVCTFAVLAQASSPISIIVDGNTIASDVPPQIINGSTMVPVRVISEALGATVSWDSSTQTVTLLNNGVHVAMTLGGYTLENGSPITLDNPAQLINGRVMVPIRFIATAFGCQVNWDASSGR